MNKNKEFPVVELNERACAKVAVKLQKNQFAKEGCENFYGKVERNTYTTQNILDVMKDDVPLVDLGTVASILNAYSTAIFNVITSGNAVKFGKMGTFYIAGKGTVDKENEKPSLTVKFSVSEELRNAVEKIEVRSSGYTEICGKIFSITDVSNGNTDCILKPGCVVALEGERLKTGGEDSGIFFVPFENGIISSDLSDWIKVETPLFSNLPSKLIFTVPENLEEGEYRIVIRTRYGSRFNYERKKLLEIVSDAVLNIV